jgi:hypothetical protein
MPPAAASISRLTAETKETRKTKETNEPVSQINSR